jgi:PhnB protein
LSHAADSVERLESPSVSAIGDEPFETNIAPWLAVRDAQKAVDFYAAAFGAVETYRLEGDDGSLQVARLSIDDAAFWVQDDVDAGPEAHGQVSIRMILSVEDPDSVFDRAVAAGAVVVAPVSEEYGWRTGRVTDPFGHDWEISRQLASS